MVGSLVRFLFEGHVSIPKKEDGKVCLLLLLEETEISRDS